MKKKALLALMLSMAMVLGPVSSPLSARADAPDSEEAVTGDETGCFLSPDGPPDSFAISRWQ